MQISKSLGVTLAGLLLVSACATPGITRTDLSPIAEPVRTSGSMVRQPNGAPEPAAFITSNMTTSTAECNIDGDMWVNVTVTNVGGQAGTYAVILKINGVVSRTENVTLTSGESRDVHFVLTQKDDLPEFFTYKLTIDNLEKDVGVI